MGWRGDTNKIHYRRINSRLWERWERWILQWRRQRWTDERDQGFQTRWHQISSLRFKSWSSSRSDIDQDLRETALQSRQERTEGSVKQKVRDDGELSFSPVFIHEHTHHLYTPSTRLPSALQPPNNSSSSSIATVSLYYHTCPASSSFCRTH